MSNFNYEIIKNKDSKILEKNLDLKSTHPIYYNINFLNLISVEVKAEPLWFVAKYNNKIVAGIPFIKKSFNEIKIINSLGYFGSYGGVISVDENSEVMSLTLKAFIKYSKKENITAITIITNPFIKNNFIYEQQNIFNFKDTRISQFTILPKEGENLITLFENPRPRNIRKAKNSGIIVSKTKTNKHIEFLFKTHKNNMLEIGGSHKSYQFFKNINKYLKNDQWQLYVAKFNGIKIASLLVFYNGKYVEYFTPSIVKEYKSYQPLSLLIYEAMIDSIKDKFEIWNWGGTWLEQKGVYDFKKKWGSNEKKYFYYTKINDNKLLNYKKDFFMKHFYGIYICPFSELAND